MDFLKKLIYFLNPAVPKRFLLAVAGLVWLLISLRIFLLMLKYYQQSWQNLPEFLIWSVPSYFVFFYYVFFKLIRKHTARIAHKADYACIFGFFDWKSYGIMGFMILLGIFMVYRFKINPDILAVFFFALSLSMFSASVYFFYYAIRFKYTLKKFPLKNNN